MMKRFRYAWGALGGLLAVGLRVAAAQPPAGQQSEFVPVSQLPAAEQVPAAPLVIAAYAFVWVAVLFYVWTVWRRVNKVEADMQTLARRVGGQSGQ
jgi:CcmD family protein